MAEWHAVCSAREQASAGQVCERGVLPCLCCALESLCETCHHMCSLHQHSTTMCFLLENGDTQDRYLIKAYCLITGLIYTFDYYWRQCEESGKVTSVVSGFSLA